MSTNPHPPPLGVIPESDSGFAIETQGLVKHFGSTRAVDGVDMVVPTGMIYGVLGRWWVSIMASPSL